MDSHPEQAEVGGAREADVSEPARGDFVYVPIVENKWHIRPDNPAIRLSVLSAGPGWSGGERMENRAVEHHQRCREREELFRHRGYDTEHEIRCIIEKARPFSGTILEIGTGKGYFTAALAREGHSVISVDISEENQELALLHLKYLGLKNLATFKIENAERLSFTNNSFDVIFSVNTLHHLDKPFCVLDELLRVLSFKGKMVLSDFSRAGFALVGKIHADEGRRHELGVITLQEAAEYISTKYFTVQTYSTTYQETLIAYRPII
ncbi:MAG: class I SAM-dependent methyltransferase [Candidatus Omnitrophica bacterium]|nr:class I SAM-dependent methyltransferase [Candidatus Omnitrophota bacterium]